MELIADRKWRKQNYTISNLTIDGRWVCNILEDTDRGLEDSMSLTKIRELKKPSITAIPKGTYKITLDVISPRFCTKTFYKQVCDGKLPRLLNVKGFEGILIHAGNTDSDTDGCLLVGMNLERGKVLKSQEVFKKLYEVLKAAKLRGEEITIKIL